MSHYEKKLPELPASFLTPPIESFLKAIGKQLDDILTFREDVVAQLFVQTATWGLKDWERWLGLYESSSLEMRRNHILSVLLRTGGMRPADLQKGLAINGYPSSEIIELFRNSEPAILHNATKTYSNEYRTSYRWALFKVLLNCSLWRDYKSTDKHEVENIIKKIKPAHMQLIGIDLKIPIDDQVKITDEIVIGGLIYKIKFTDLFLRPGLRHSGQINYPKALIRDAVVLYNASIRHYQFISDVIIPHRLVGEEIMVAQSVGGPR